jgi:signal transduction histidine kinase
MAQGQAMAGPFGAVSGIVSRAAGGAARNIRLTVLVCVVLICGSFAGATLLQMRLDRAHALAQAQYFETRRAHDIAAMAGMALERYGRLGAIFADNPQTDMRVTDPWIRNIVVFDSHGAVVNALHGSGTDIPPLPRAAFAGQYVVSASLVVVQHRGQVIAISFNPASLPQPAILTRAALLLRSGQVLASGADWDGRIFAAVPVHGWPLIAATSLDQAAAAAAWHDTLPLSLFLILGSALVGGFLAIVFVREFERRARATAAIRNLKTMRPVEARLLVRLANAERNAVESLRAKSEFIAHMSHELRTPLNAIIGFSEVIAQGLYGAVGHPKYAEYAHDIGSAGRNLHAKIGDILEFANVEAGRWPLQIARVDVAAIAQAVVDEHAGCAFTRRIILEMGVGEAAEARADLLAVRRILTNLVCNALRYTAEGGTVRVDVRSEEGAVVATVRDNGIGFTRGEHRSAGAPFQRFDRAGTVTGGGLGLAIAMGLARRLGGAMRLASVPGEGTLMELRLPRA